MPIKMISKRLIGALGPAGIWLIALLFLTLSLPAGYWAALPVQGPDRPFELSSLDFSSEVVGSPADPTSYGKTAKQSSEKKTELAVPALADQLVESGAIFLQVIIIPPWLVSDHPQFLPRPPPLS
ncbi:MAG TPA: hypothetical protein VD811_00030 [Desulfuromonadales bacterium]|nr:hypothetical protein [Desulfuromonadales bacterium]